MNPHSPESAYPPGAMDARGADHAGADVTTSDDVALLRRVAAGDDMAFATFYDRWVQPVYTIVVHLLRDADEAEDVLEETFWQVWQRAASFDPARGSPRTWVLTIARSRALDRLRARGRRPDAAPLPDLLASDDADPSVSVEAQARREQVTRALATLPEEQRRALELAYFGGYTQAEIAEHSNEPLGTIKTRMRLGMLKLRALLLATRGEI